MKSFLRALLISTVATSVAAVVIKVLQGQEKHRRSDNAVKGNFVDAERLSDAERSHLSDELDAML